ncbi:MAG: sensor histidine kinase [Myxococcota bacterium]
MARVRHEGPPKVVVVSGDAGFRREASEALGTDHEVSTEASAGGAAATVEEGRVRAVVCDESLGDDALFTLAVAARQAPAAARILVGPAEDADRVVEAVNRAGIHRYVRAPWRAEALADAVREEIERSRRGEVELARATRSLGHDLRGPLQTIQGYAELLSLRFRSQLDESAGRFLDNLLEGVGRTSKLLEAMLSYLTARRAVLEPEAVALDRVVDAARANVAGVLEEAEADVEVGDLPAVRGDQARLGTVMEHLLANAACYRRGPGVRIRVDAQRRDGEVEVSVRDDGRGMPAEDAPAAFDPFVRLCSDDEVVGEGMGLAIARVLVEKHGGRIWLETEPDRGTTVRFTLPAA